MGYSKLLIDAFGGGTLNDIAEIVKNFDFSKITYDDDSSQLFTSLAPSFGTLDSGAIQTMDDGIKVMISETMHTLADIPPRERTWDRLVSAMLQNSVISPHPDTPIARSDRFENKGTHAFKFSGAPDPVIVRKVDNWFEELISNSDVRRATNIDIDVLAKIVAQSGATIDSFESFFGKTESHSKTMVDIGVLRFPSISDPYFEMYKIKLRAWSDCTRIIFFEWDSNGIDGEYDSRKFIPNREAIAGLNKDVHQKAVDEANHLFDDEPSTMPEYTPVTIKW